MNGATQTETLFGSSKIAAKLRGGQTVEVAVRQIPLREMQSYLEAQANECSLIELCCKTGNAPISKEMVDSLTEESHIGLLAEIDRINSDFFSRWANRTKERGDRLKGMFGVPK